MHCTLEYIKSLRQSARLGSLVKGYDFREGCDAELRDIPDDLPAPIGQMLSNVGIGSLYSHQLKAFNAIRQGRHVVVSTPTASGKSLIYNLALFEKVVHDKATRALYVYPLKALTRDQLKNFNNWSHMAGRQAPSAAVYDGDTSAYQRRKIRQNMPNVIMTNPEMVHLALLPHHEKWRTFFKKLELVVIDEVHVYRGLLGSHMAQVLKRLQRICRFYGARPTFVFTSATIDNPGELTGQLTGLNVQTIQRSGAPLGGRHIALIDPSEGPAHTAILLLKAAMARQLRTIVYTQSRKLAELISLWVQQGAGKLADKISVYRAGLLPEERRRIESDLKSGKMLAVVSTSALELGIDIGDLDLCVLVGYPGSMMATLQRGGRVGRKGQESTLIMIAGQDALDQYYISNPQAFFNGRSEAAVVNPHNEVILKAHLICAAAELPLKSNEPWIRDDGVSKVAALLESKGSLLRSADDRWLYARDKRPHHKVNLRSAGKRFLLLHGDTVIGEVNDFRLYRETHPGAIYLHQGKTYRVLKVDEAAKGVSLRPAEVDYYTRVRTDTDVDILEVYKEKYIGNTKICIGKVKVTDQVCGYVRVRTGTGQINEGVDLDVPPSVFETDSIWFEIASAHCTKVHANGYDLPGTLHAMEHASIGITPLMILADRNDLGGLATPFHPKTDSAAIFIYDGLPGGAGLSRQIYPQVRRLLENARDVIDRCRCEEGCPACIHSPKCGSGNHPMDKSGAHFLIQQILRPQIATAYRVNPTIETVIQADNIPNSGKLKYGVFDLETQRSAKEVGGWHNAHRMRVSCGVVYDSIKDTFVVYLQDQVGRLIAHLKQFETVVGFNSKRFDYKVLSGYSDYDFSTVPSYDLLEQVHQRLGFRLSLDHLAKQTLNVNKFGSGLDALKWWQAGEVDKIIDYCLTDVRITRDLFLFARENGYLIYRRKSGERLRIPMQPV
jgi:DEAD/DEAH box helicase domain-containing protein